MSWVFDTLRSMTSTSLVVPSQIPRADLQSTSKRLYWYSFIGVIDDVRIWDVALTDEDVALLVAPL